MKSFSPQDWELFNKAVAFDHSKVEKAVEDHPDHYKNLVPEALYTSQKDLEAIFQSGFIQGTWVDLGCGTGFSALLYAFLHPERIARGVEISYSRVRAGKRAQQNLNLQNVELIEGDLFSCPIPDGQSFLLYFPTGMVLDRILDELMKKNQFVLVAIESHGDLLPRLKKDERLKVIGEIPLTALRHHPQAVVFEKSGVEIKPGPHQYSYQYSFLEIKSEDSSRWLGESQGLEWLTEERYHLLYPPRTIEWGNVIRIVAPGDIEKNYERLSLIRRLGELKIHYKDRLIRGVIRKIQIYPSFKLEISSGDWLEWDEVKRITFGDTLCYESSSDYFFSLPAPWES